MAKRNKLNVKELKRFAEDCRERSLRHDDTAMVTFVHHSPVHFSPINSSGDRLMEQVKSTLTDLIAYNPNGITLPIIGIETEVTATLFIHDDKLETSIMSYLTRYSYLIEEETRYDKMIDHARGICLLADYYSEWREESEDDPEHYWTMYWHDIFLAFSMNVQFLLDDECHSGLITRKPAKPVEKIMRTGNWFYKATKITNNPINSEQLRGKMRRHTIKGCEQPKGKNSEWLYPVDAVIAEYPHCAQLINQALTLEETAADDGG